jgi:hypothetical protein
MHVVNFIDLNAFSYKIDDDDATQEEDASGDDRTLCPDSQWANQLYDFRGRVFASRG